ncbi:MAG TPA: hypothetical protein VF658_01005 [Pyrinomonadaceae bacterium]
MSQQDSQKSIMAHAVKAIGSGLCVLTLIFCVAQTSVAQFRTLTKKQAQLYLRNLPAVDKVELVKFKSDADVKEGQIESSKFVGGAAARKIAGLWRTQTYGPDNSACHYPAYAIRFYVKGQPWVYASVCWACSNIKFFAPDFKGGLHFEGDNKNGQQLLQIFKEAFPETRQTVFR